MSLRALFDKNVPADASCGVVIYPTAEAPAVAWCGMSASQAEQLLRSMADEIREQHHTQARGAMH